MPTPESSSDSIALLIDADNAPAAKIDFKIDKDLHCVRHRSFNVHPSPTKESLANMSRRSSKSEGGHLRMQENP